MPTTEPVEPVQVRSDAIPVLTLKGAATRLGMSRAELEAMIARGQVETLPIEFGCVRTSEVERLLQHR